MGYPGGGGAAQWASGGYQGYPPGYPYQAMQGGYSGMLPGQQHPYAAMMMQQFNAGAAMMMQQVLPSLSRGGRVGSPAGFQAGWQGGQAEAAGPRSDSPVYEAAQDDSLPLNASAGTVSKPSLDVSPALEPDLVDLTEQEAAALPPDFPTVEIPDDEVRLPIWPFEVGEWGGMMIDPSEAGA